VGVRPSRNSVARNSRAPFCAWPPANPSWVSAAAGLMSDPRRARATLAWLEQAAASAVRDAGRPALL